MNSNVIHETFMKEALKEAEKAFEKGEVYFNENLSESYESEVTCEKTTNYLERGHHGHFSRSRVHYIERPA